MTSSPNTFILLMGYIPKTPSPEEEGVFDFIFVLKRDICGGEAMPQQK